MEYVYAFLWHDFDNCPLLPAPSPGALSRPTHPRALDTHPHLPNCLSRSPLSISEARQGPWDQLSTTPSSWVLLSGVPPFFAYLNWGAGLLAGLSSTLSPHPITVPPSGGWAEGLHSKLPALALGSQPREDVLPLLSPLATALCTGAVAAAAAAPW